jgi:NADP-dependent alcohol dehydrogenase
MMKDFSFHNPTKIVFGAGVVDQVGTACREQGRRALLVLGQGSARRTGLLERVLASLEAAGVEAVLHEGVRPNPVLSHVRAGIERGRSTGVDHLLAVGGGSVLDSAKAIAAGLPAAHDVWDFFAGRERVKAALPLVTVLTLAATGSEMNGGGVVTNEETREKLPFGSPHTYPKVSFLEPALTLSLPPEQTANGLADAFAHLFEPYVSALGPEPRLQLELKEACFRSLLDCGRRLLADPADLESRGDFMWTATMALNGVTSAGLGSTLWPVHLIEHALSAVTDIAHGAGLAALMPGWLEWRAAREGERPYGERFRRLGRQVFGLVDPGPAETAVALRTWFRSVGAPASLEEAGIDAALDGEIAANAARTATAWGMKDYSADAVGEILAAARQGGSAAGRTYP